MNKTVLAALVIAGVVVVAGCVIILQPKDDETTDEVTTIVSPTIEKIETKLVVFGNANNDSYLDNKDREFIKNIVDGKTQWNKNKNYLADVNVDGVVDAKDLKLLDKFLEKKKAKMYYVDWDKKVRSVNFPMTGKVSGGYDTTLLMGGIVGFYDDVTHMLKKQEEINSMSPLMFPGADKIKSIGTYPYTYESVVASGVKIVLGDPYCFTDSFLDRIAESTDINCIIIPQNRSINGEDWATNIVTLGVMMGLEKNTKPYIKYCEDIDKKISSVMANITAKQLTYLISYNPSSNVTVSLDIHGTGPVTYGDVHNVEILPLKCAMEPRNSDGYVTSVQMEEIIKINPDVMIIDTTGYAHSTKYNMAQYQAEFERMAGYFSKTGAYKNGMVFGLSYENYGTVPGVAGILLLASKIWPEQFNEKDGWDSLQEFYTKFTKYTGDVKDLPGPAPLKLNKP